MLTAAQVDSVQAILLTRELQALKALNLFRIVLVLVMFPLTLLVAFSTFERLSTAGFLLIYAVVLVYCAVLLAKRRHLRIVGLAGANLDVILVALLPFIWYSSVSFFCCSKRLRRLICCRRGPPLCRVLPS